MSPLVMRCAYKEMTLPVRPARRRSPLRTVTGSKVPLRSRGTRKATLPISVVTVLGCEPLRLLRDPRPSTACGSEPARPVISTSSPVWRTWRTRAVNNPSSPVSSTPSERARSTSSAAHSRIAGSSPTNGTLRGPDTAVPASTGAIDREAALQEALEEEVISRDPPQPATLSRGPSDHARLHTPSDTPSPGLTPESGVHQTGSTPPG